MIAANILSYIKKRQAIERSDEEKNIACERGESLEKVRIGEPSGPVRNEKGTLTFFAVRGQGNCASHPQYLRITFSMIP